MCLGMGLSGSVSALPGNTKLKKKKSAELATEGMTDAFFF